MIDALTNGRPGTAMMSFTSVLDADAIQAVVEFVRQEFMQRRVEQPDLADLRRGGHAEMLADRRR